MKKLLLRMLIVVCLLSVFTSPAYAQARYGKLFVTDPIESETSLVLPAGTWVYGMKIFADDANSFMAICDSATYQVANAAIVDELGEATQYDSAKEIWETPIYFENGVSLVILTGVGFVYYGPEPSY